MARPNKVNLQYFPLDVTFFEDHKVLMIEEEFGIKGGYIALRLMAMVYEQGYFIEWMNNQEVSIAKRVGNGITSALVVEVLKSCLKNNLFNKEIFTKKSILTSRGIQKRWLEVMELMRRKVIINESIWLVNSEETIISSEETHPPETFSTQKESKRNKIKKSKSHSGAKAPVQSKETTKYWKKLVDAWFEFYGNRFKKDDNSSAKPIFNKTQAGILKQIIDHLEKIATESKRDWTEEYAVYCLKGFLQKGWNHDEWIRKNFELGNLLTKFNSITNKNLNGNNDSKGVKQISSSVDYSAAI